jgi:hypothetical protein
MTDVGVNRYHATTSLGGSPRVDTSLLEHVGPIEWDNVVLYYGQ